MKKFFAAMLVALAAVCILVGCDGEKAVGRSVVEVGLSADMSRSLVSSVDKDIVFWEFMATPKFSLAAGEKIYGTVSYWKDLADLKTGDDAVVKTTCTLGRYTSGDWLFEVRALNANHQVIAVGSTQQIIRDGLDNTIHVDMYVDRADGTHGESADDTSRTAGSTSITDGVGNGTFQTTQYGTLRVGFYINRLDAEVSNISMSVYRQKVLRDGTLSQSETVEVGAWTVKESGDKIPEWYNTEAEPDQTVGDARLWYGCELPGLDAGPYIYTFLVSGKDEKDPEKDVILGGQAVDVLVIGGEVTEVKGTLLANEYVLAGLKVTAPGMIVGTINGVSFIKGTVGQAVDLEFVWDEEDSAEAPARYFWYIDGDETTETTGKLTFECPKDDSGNWLYGIYRVSCSPTGELGSIGNSVVDVIFNPEEGPNVGEFDFSGIGV